MNVEDALNRVPEPLEPSDGFFDSILQRIDEETPVASDTPVAAATADSTSEGTQTTAPQRPRRRFFISAAAVVLLVGGIAIVPQLARNNGASDLAQQNVPSSRPPASLSKNPTPNSGAETPSGTDQMHEIMTANDLRKADINGHGLSIAVVASTKMGKAGAMVQGTPTVANGMGAQVWAIMKDGSATSAGVIDRAPHSDVWMPLPAGTMRVTITEEPRTGSHAPSGEMLYSQDVS